MIRQRFTGWEQSMYMWEEGSEEGENSLRASR